MKKTLILMLSVLLILSFTSCQDNREDVIAAYEDYYKVSKLFANVTDIVEVVADGSGNVNLTVSKADVEEDSLQESLSKLGLGAEVTEITSASGSITGTDGDAGKNLAYTNIVIKYKLDGDNTEQQFTLGGTVVYSSTTNSGKTTAKSEIAFTINGTEYSISMTAEDEKATSVTVNGKSVDVRLINSRISDVS